MLYLISGRDRILQVDAKGKTRRIIWAPGERHQQGGYFTNSVLFVGQSQGRLHCIIEDGHDDMAQLLLFDAMQFWDLNCGVSVWVLQDSDAQEWVLKGRVSYMQLFGKMTSDGNVQYRVAGWPRCIRIATWFSLSSTGTARWYRMTSTVRKFRLSTPTCRMTIRLLLMFRTCQSYFSG